MLKGADGLFSNGLLFCAIQFVYCPIWLHINVDAEARYQMNI